MSLNVKTMLETRASVSIPVGTYQARIIGIVELGFQETTYKGKYKRQRQVAFLFDVYENQTAKPVVIGKSYTMSICENANLRKAINSIRGRDFTEEELGDWDLKQLLDMPCTVSVGQYEKNGFKNAKIVQVGMPVEGSTVPESTKEHIYFDMDDYDTWKSFARMPKWVQLKINNSITFKEGNIYLDETGEAFTIAETIAEENEHETCAK